MSCLGKFGSDRSSIHLQRRWSHLYCAGFRERALPHACNDSIRQGKANEPASARQRCRSVPDRRTTPRPPATFPQVLCRGHHPKALLAKLGRIQRACGALTGARRGGGGKGATSWLAGQAWDKSSASSPRGDESQGLRLVLLVQTEIDTRTTTRTTTTTTTTIKKSKRLS